MEKNFFKSFYQGVLKALPTKPALYLMYFRGYHKILNLKNPQYYGEKIQWMKLHGKLEELGPYVDKYEVRKFISQTIGEEYLFKIIGIYNDVNEIDFDKLPKKWVAKCTNGSQSVFICKDNSKINVNDAKNEMTKWLHEDFYKIKKEFQYKNVKNRILIEEYMEDESGGLKDYKFYCFNGKPRYFSVFTGRFSNKTVDTYSIDGTFIPDFKNGSAKTKTSKQPAKTIENLERFVELAEKLSKPFTFVRIDFYMVNHKVYFGELTFTDGAGCEPMFPIDKYDLAFGKAVPLQKILL